MGYNGRGDTKPTKEGDRMSCDVDRRVGWAPNNRDRDLLGFGVRVYSNGTKVYVVQTRVGGKSKRITVDRHGVISTDQARRKAAQMIARIKAGEDPKPEAAKKPTGPTVAELAERYLAEHVEVRCKPRTVDACRWLVKNFVLPDLNDMAIAAVQRGHITDLHHKHRNTPYQANRILEVVRKMFNLAEAWGLREDGSNPCRHVQMYKEKKRERFLTEAEFHRLGQVLNEFEAEDPENLASVTAIRLLMLTGCRLNEIQTLRWEDVDLESAELRLRDTKTGARMVPLSNAAVRVLALGESLPMIGKLLGHTQVQTTARYAHLANESVKESGSRVGDSIGIHIAPDVP